MPLQILILMAAFGIPIAPTFWAIFDIPKRRFSSRKQQIIWLVVVSTLPFFGAMFYILVVRRRTEPLEVSGH